MDRETRAAHIVQRIAAELSVPMASFYEPEAPSDSEAMRKAVAAILGASAVVCDPDERRRSVAIMPAEAKRLRNLPDGDD